MSEFIPVAKAQMGEEELAGVARAAPGPVFTDTEVAGARREQEAPARHRQGHVQGRLRRPVIRRAG